MPKTEHEVEPLPRRLAIVLLALLFAAPFQSALGGAARAPTTMPAAAPGRRLASDDAARIEAEIRHVREGATASAWIAAHPSDLVETFDGRVDDHDTDAWCVRARHTGTLADGGAWERTAYFFVPPPPPDLTLPRAAAKQLQGECQLGLVWIEAPPAARQAMSRAMTSASGHAAVQGGVPVHGAGADFRQDIERWPSHRPHAVLARDGDGAREEPTRPRRARLRLALPAWERWDERVATTPASLALPERESAALAAAVRALPAIEERSRAAMLALLAKHDFLTYRAAPTTADVVRAFTSWTEAARRLPPGARVDALLVADRIMEFVSGNGWKPEPWEAGETLRVANARFVHDPLAAAHVYAHSLLEEALEIVAPAAAHDRALLREMELGFDHSGRCDAGDSAFEQVIATGEPLIARSRDPKTLSAAHFMVGDAYATIVALARGAGGEYADPGRHQEREGEARAKALAHFRSGLALDSASDTARGAWQTAWRLAADLPPVWARYFCVSG